MLKSSSIATVFFGLSFARRVILRDNCSHDNCLRALLGSGSEAVAFCQTYTAGNDIPSFAANCDGDITKVFSACSCLYTAPPSGSTSTVVTSKDSPLLI